MGRPARKGRGQQHHDSEPVSNNSRFRDRKARNGSREREGYGEIVSIDVVNKQIKPFYPKTDNQRLLMASVRTNTLTITDGPPGVGKTRVSLQVAAEELKSGKIDYIICTKPMTEIDEALGTLPGSEQEKIDVAVRPMRQELEKIMGKGHVEYLEKAGKIIFAHLGSILGLTFDRAFAFIDEAQNTTPFQMRVFLTRIGHHSKVVVSGDAARQKAINGLSGLEDALMRFDGEEEVGHVRFTPEDSVRSDFCKRAIRAYDKPMKKLNS